MPDGTQTTEQNLVVSDTAAARIAKLREIQAASYTHLTLPTIYSV